MSNSSIPWKEILHQRLAASEEEAIGYLNACREENDPALLLAALRDVAEARGGLNRLAQQAGLNHESLSRTLSESGNPTLGSFYDILDALNIQMTFCAKKAA